MRFKNDDGRKFAIRILRQFDLYGDDDALTYEQHEPSIEVFEATGFDGEEADILGYFTGIRCTVSTLFLEHSTRNATVNDEFAIWNISEINIEAIKHWLVSELTETEKAHVTVPLTLNPLPAKPTPHQPPSQSSLTAELSQQRSELDLTETTRMACCEPYSHASGGQPFLRQELEAALQALDLAETAESQWRQGDVHLRLRIIAAKQEILQAIALLNPTR